MVQLYGLSDIGCEQNRQLQAVPGICFTSQVRLYLMNKSNMTSISASTFEFKGIMQTQDMTASGMICCPCPLRNIPSSSDTHSCIFVVYSDGAESGRKMRSHQNVHESWSYLKSQASRTFACWPHPSLWTIIHMIWNWEWFWGMCCRNHSNDLWKHLGNWCFMNQNKNF